VFGLTRRQLASRVAIGLAALLLLAQAVPYGHAHSNPPVTRAARWSDLQAEGLAQQSCYDCHSNLTRWRWYSYVAPASWLVQSDVDGARKILDFSEWDHGQANVNEVINVIAEGAMPPSKYTIPHPSSKLSSEERDRLIAGIRRLYAEDPPGS
jgi:hypothetical protein